MQCFQIKEREINPFVTSDNWKTKDVCLKIYENM